MGHAFNIRLRDAELHAYAQKYCFLNGPDAATNRKLRELLPESTVALPEEEDEQRIRLLSQDEQRAISREWAAGLHVPSELGLSADTIEKWTRNLAWKVREIPKTAKNVLVLGCSTCREAIFIRHWLPEATITCTDFEDARLPNIESAIGTRFHQGDFHDLLAENRRGFDAVFSNHVLEHLFDPGRTLKAVNAGLREGGVLVSALPLDGQAKTPFSHMLNAKRLHPLDLGSVDVAHAWKTNVTAMLQALREAGYGDVQFLGRDGHFSVADRVFRDRQAFERQARLGGALNGAIFGAARAVLKRAFPRDVPPLVLKTVFGAESRVWFGANRLKNDFSLECLVVAKGGDGD